MIYRIEQIELPTVAMSIQTLVHPTRTLAQSPLFQIRSEELPKEEQVALSYSRTKAVAQTYSASLHSLLASS